MSRRIRNIVISLLLLITSIVYTMLIGVIDVQPVGANSTDIGFSTINTFFAQKIGSNTLCYEITKYLGIIPIVLVVVYAFIGLRQLIKRKSFKKVDMELYALGGLFAAVAGVYLFFEKFIINYRPILMDGVLEASYPSSHTMLTMCVCGGVILTNKQIFDSKFTKVMNILLNVLIVGMIIGRFISGVHWFTDIIGGILISSTLLMIFYTLLNIIKYED